MIDHPYLKDHPFFHKLHKDNVCQGHQNRLASLCESTARSILNGGTCIIAPYDLVTKSINLEILIKKIANLFHALYLHGMFNLIIGEPYIDK